jgi:hypothetical protein
LQTIGFETLRTWVLNRLDAKADEHYFDRRGTMYSLASVRPEFGISSNIQQSPLPDVPLTVPIPHYSIRPRF